ncbi:MAG: 5-deoxy-glucuronate isomerase [Acidobacteriota bacterium]
MSETLFHSEKPDPWKSGVTLEVPSEKAGWDLLDFKVWSIPAGHGWTTHTGHQEVCLVLLSGKCRICWEEGEEHTLGPRENVFAAYPHAVYMPAGTQFRVVADEFTELAEGRAPSEKSFSPRLISPADCGFEIRGGGNATRQIIDIIPPDFPADRLLVCEVYTPGGNWSSFPPHKHDRDNPPLEVELEEVYYYRFAQPEGFGFQRLYSADGSRDQTFRVREGDLVLIRDGYHPFVTIYGHDAYYLNVLAGQRRSMAASDDPLYAAFRMNWPPPDPRLPLLSRPRIRGS